MFFRCTQPWQAPTAPLLSGVSCSVLTLLQSQGLSNSALSMLIWHGWTGVRRQDEGKTRWQSQRRAPRGHSPKGAVGSLPGPPCHHQLDLQAPKVPMGTSYLNSLRRKHSILYCFLVAKQRNPSCAQQGKKYRIKCKFKACLCYKGKKCTWRILGGNYKISPGHWQNLTASGQNPQAFQVTSEYHIHSCFKFSFYWETQVPKWLFVEY